MDALQSRLFLTFASMTPDFARDEEGNATKIEIVRFCLYAENLIPNSPRHYAEMSMSETMVRNLAQNPEELPIEFLKRISHLSRGFNSIHEKHYYCSIPNDEELYDHIVALFQEGLKVYFDRKIWVKHICKTHDIKAGDTITLSNGFTFTVKEDVRVITEP